MAAANAPEEASLMPDPGDWKIRSLPVNSIAHPACSGCRPKVIRVTTVLQRNIGHSFMHLTNDLRRLPRGKNTLSGAFILFNGTPPLQRLVPKDSR